MSKFATYLKTSLTPIALCFAIVIAAPALAHKERNKNQHEMRQLLSELNLSVAQKQDIKQLMKETREDRKVIKTDVQSFKKALHQLVQAEQWQQNEIENLLTEQQAFKQQQALARAFNKHQVWKLLTTSQQTDLSEKMQSYKEDRLENNSGDRQHAKRQKSLNLSPEQLATMATLKAEKKEGMQQHKAKLHEFKQQERVLIQSDEFDPQAWQNLSEQYQADFLALAILEAKTRHQTWNLLTSEQQSKIHAKKSKHKRA